ncbi:hypothetical protein [Sporolactobacillus pectinivorans]|uniref:hypothetical protein n=1 Tax=Sporolactobacillus pectinivorans TaxID=1591408 RepID=UPI000C2668FD|nr:hypothetical protein [Sporolactobacillus pectinivorans]
MKLFTFLLLPFLTVSLLLATPGQATAGAIGSPVETSSKVHCQDANNQWLTRTIDEYASPALKVELRKDLAAHEQLCKTWQQSPAFQKQKKHCKEDCKSFHHPGKKKVDEILTQVKEGKLTVPEARKQLQGMHHGMHGKVHTFQQLKAAVESKNKPAVEAALKKMDQQIKESNQRLKQKISENS